MQVKQGLKFSRFYCPALGIEFGSGMIVAFDKEFIEVAELGTKTTYTIPRVTPYLIEMTLVAVAPRRFFGT